MLQMKKVKYLVCFLVSVLVMQSCFQNMEEPEFNYPTGTPDPTGAYEALKIHLTFDQKILDVSTYQFIPSLMGDIEYVDGKIGKAIKLSKDTSYILLDRHPAIDELMRDTLSNLGSFTLAFWMNCERNKSATGIFTISNTKTFWGNLEVFFENTSSETEAFIKVHMNNIQSGANKESWQEVRFPNGFQKWNHVVFSYNGSKSEFNVYQNGVNVLKKDLDNYGPLKFENLGSLVIGTCQFQTQPSLTSGSGNQTWAGWYKGDFDDLRFYNKALSDADIKIMFEAKN